MLHCMYVFIRFNIRESSVQFDPLILGSTSSNYNFFLVHCFFYIMNVSLSEESIVWEMYGLVGGKMLLPEPYCGDKKKTRQGC